MKTVKKRVFYFKIKNVKNVFNIYDMNVNLWLWIGLLSAASLQFIQLWECNWTVTFYRILDGINSVKVIIGSV